MLDRKGCYYVVSRMEERKTKRWLFEKEIVWLIKREIRGKRKQDLAQFNSQPFLEKQCELKVDIYDSFFLRGCARKLKDLNQKYDPHFFP